MNPLLPQPHRFTCAHCGFGWDEPGAFCPRYGAKPTQQQKRPLSTGAQIVLGVSCILVASLGACFGTVGAFAGGGFWYLAVGVVLLAAAFGLGRFVARNGK